MLTADSDAGWLSKFHNLSSPLHKFKHVNLSTARGGKAWGDVGNDNLWSVVFVDHKPGPRRRYDIERLRCVAELVVVHDTQSNWYEYPESLRLYRYKLEYRRLITFTMILSNYFPLDPFVQLLGPKFVID